MATTKAKPEAEDLVPEAEAELLTLEGPPVGETVPVVRARVVYLGANPVRSLSLRGGLQVERAELESGETLESKTAGTSGRTKYDFALRDTHGRLLRQRLLPGRATVGGVEVGGRPFVVCEHAGHLVQFDERRGPDNQREFLVLFDRPEDKRIMDEYAARVRRYRTRAQTQLVENVS